MSTLLREFMIAGTKFHKIKYACPNQGDFLKLEAEPTNPYDANAIRILWIDNSTEWMLGYVPRNLTHEVHPLLGQQIDVILSLCVLNLESTKPAFAMCTIYGDPTLIQEPEDKPATTVNIEPEIDL